MSNVRKLLSIWSVLTPGILAAGDGWKPVDPKSTGEAPDRMPVSKTTAEARGSQAKHHS